VAKAAAKLPLLERLLTRLADAVCSHSRRFVWPQIFLAIACAGFTVWKLEFHTSRNDLIGADKEYHRNFLKFLDEFPLQDDLVVVVESGDIERNRQFVARLGSDWRMSRSCSAAFFTGATCARRAPTRCWSRRLTSWKC